LMRCLTQCVSISVRNFDLTIDSFLTSSDIALLTSCSSVSEEVAAEALMVCFLTCLDGLADGLESSPCPSGWGMTPSSFFASIGYAVG